MSTSGDVSLDRLAGSLLDSHADEVGDRGEPMWLQLEWTGHEWRNRIVPGLFGRQVASRFGAVAVVATGRLHNLDAAHEPPASLRSGFAGGISLACVMDRQGQVGWSLRLPDGGRYDTHPDAGLMLDTLRRALDLPTDAPPESNVRVQIAGWIADVIDRAPAGRRLDWDGLLAAHPLLEDVPYASARQAEMILEAISRIYDWDAMRRSVAEGRIHQEELSPAIAGWMDTGMFARWILDFTPPFELVFQRAAGVATPAAAHRLRRFVHRLVDHLDAERTA